MGHLARMQTLPTFTFQSGGEKEDSLSAQEGAVLYRGLYNED